MKHTYQIVRFYKDIKKDAEVVAKGLTLEAARKHCKDPSTSTEEYFDGFTKENWFTEFEIGG